MMKNESNHQQTSWAHWITKSRGPNALGTRFPVFWLVQLVLIWKRMHCHARKLVILIRNGTEDEKKSMSWLHHCTRVHIPACAQARGSFVTIVTMCMQIWLKLHFLWAEPSDAHHLSPFCKFPIPIGMTISDHLQITPPTPVYWSPFKNLVFILSKACSVLI